MPTYKLSKYNHYLEQAHDRRHLVYNAVSNGLAALEPDVYALLQRGERGLAELAADSARAPLLQQLHAGHVIVDEDLDEIEFMRLKMNLSRFNSNGLSLTLVPTLGCNLGCTYCYEGLRNATFMDPETEDAVVAFAGAQIKRFSYRLLSVSWFGGEPLLRPAILYSLSRKLIKLCKAEKVNYRAMVVTNGTNLTRTTARRLRGLKVTHAQVTIDGPKDVHDARRPFRGGRRSSFDVITNNVERVLGILPVQVRVNVDKTNYHRSLELVDDMRSRGWFEPGKQCAFYVGYTRVWTPVCSSIADQCFTMEEFSETELKFQQDLMGRGFTLGNLYPSGTSYCVAAGPNGFVIGPRGELYKCWSDVNNDEAAIGNIRAPLEMNARLVKWLSYDPLTKFAKCRDCEFFPICAGGCPSIGVCGKDGACDESNCSPWKLLMKKKIEVFLAHRTSQVSQAAGSEARG